MRDYNAIQFRSPSDKHQQRQEQQQATANSTTAYSGILNTVRSTSLSPIPKASQGGNNSYSNGHPNYTNNKMVGSSSTSTQARTPMSGTSYSNNSGVTTSTTVASSSVASNSDAIRLPFLPNSSTGTDMDDEFIKNNNNNNNIPLQQQQQQQQQQSSLSIASTNVITNTTSGQSNVRIQQPRLNQVSTTTVSSPQRSTAATTTTTKSYHSSSLVENAISLSPTPYTNTTGSHTQQQQQQFSNTATQAANTTTATTNVPNSNSSIATTSSSAIGLSPSDALALRRDYNNNSELYIQKLRTEIQQQQTTIQKISSASSKSDAVILELRSTIRQYKRQLEKLQQQQQTQTDRDVVNESGNDTSFHSGTITTATTDQQQQQTSPPVDIHNHPLVVEMTEQLHDLQNKLMTADLIRKELEDTIEAEQYTWELRVQDLEREVNELKQQLVLVTTASTSNSTKVAEPMKHVSRSTGPTVISAVDTLNNRSDDHNNAATMTTANEDEYRKQLEDAQSEIQRYRTIIMTSTTTSDMDDDNNNMNVNASMNTDSSSNNNNNNILLWKEKVLLLEQERMELQGCLDEALKELEAVDLELQQEDTTNALRDENEQMKQIIQQLQAQQDGGSERRQMGLIFPDHDETNDTTVVMEQLQHLYRWLIERDGSDESQQSIQMIMMKMNQQYHTIDEWLRVIQQYIDQHCTTVLHVQELERQISVYKGDIYAKEEETNEVRNSLKEAVSLLRPIQDSVTKLEKEKGKYQESLQGLESQQQINVMEIRKYKQLINDKDDEIDHMKEKVESLEIQLSKAKLVVANTVVAQHNIGNTSRSMADPYNNNNNISTASSPSEALDEKRAKRRTGENNLKELLRDAQLRGDGGTGGGDAAEREQQLRTIQEYEQEISLFRDELAKNDATIQSLQLNLTSAKDELFELQQQEQNKSSTADQSTNLMLQEAELRVQTLEEELQDTKRALASKRDTERSLNRSLKDALGLIKPLQVHLEESEMEKRQIAQELELVMKQQEQQRSASLSRSLPDGSNNVITNAVSVEVVKDLESTVRLLENENAMLQDALEDMSQSLNASHISGATSARSPSNTGLSSKQQQQHPTSMNDTNNNKSTRLHQEFVELQSRYEVTQLRLQDAYHKNNTLSELVQQEQDDKFLLHDEVVTLREQLSLQQLHKGTTPTTKSSVSSK